MVIFIYHLTLQQHRKTDQIDLFFLYLLIIYRQLIIILIQLQWRDKNEKKYNY